MPLKTTFIGALMLLFGLLLNAHGQTQREVDKTYLGLRGNVKSVSQEAIVFDLVNGQWVEKPRVMVERTTFDATGNQARVEYYDGNGKLSTTYVYTFLGKHQVATATEAPDSTALISVEPLRKGQRIDPRYTYKFIHQYDPQGRRTQTAVYLSDGKLWLRHLFKFGPNRKTRLSYSKGRLNQKLEFRLDDRGNEISIIEQAAYVVSDKTVYKYEEFDVQGNWTKRIVYRSIKEFDDTAITRAHPWSIEYRVITYY